MQVEGPLNLDAQRSKIVILTWMRKCINPRPFGPFQTLPTLGRGGGGMFQPFYYLRLVRFYKRFSIDMHYINVQNILRKLILKIVTDLPVQVRVNMFEHPRQIGTYSERTKSGAEILKTS